MSLAAFHPAQFRLPRKHPNRFSADMRADAGPRDRRSFTAGGSPPPPGGKGDPAPGSPGRCPKPTIDNRLSQGGNHESQSNRAGHAANGGSGFQRAAQGHIAGSAAGPIGRALYWLYGASAPAAHSGRSVLHPMPPRRQTAHGVRVL